ncbi:HTTM domain-containing protein [Halovivax gelatinilyticus]|uniref:HTTM domain-containing protein n=1 Tax=Halovivax gelatinilyticus TaxID=2961597 RepID=UPI0020CA477A|nr:HTTM domain-containing protein [Halovivax gelatinilyticus]
MPSASPPRDEATASDDSATAHESVDSTPKPLDRIRRRIRERATVDTRALATLRIALGVILLIDLAHRAGDISTFYTDDGAYPRASYETASLWDGYSIHALSGELWVQVALFAVAAAFAIALVCGYRTRLVAVVSLVLLVSLHARNPALLNGGDRLLRVVLFVALVTPLGERWSVDALRRGRARTRVAGVGVAALLVQPVAVFTANALQKRDGDTWFAGEAVEIAMANDEMTILLGNHLDQYATLLELGTWLWVALLSGSALLLLGTTGRLRALVALCYIGAFAGMALTLSVGLFPYVLAASVVPFLTTPFWDRLARLVPERVKSATGRIPAAVPGPLTATPVERRALARLRRNGNASTASFAVAFGRSFLTVAGVLVLCWILLFSATNATDYDAPSEIEAVAPDEQHWGLYAPDPSETYTWYVSAAELEDGTVVDAVDGGEVLTDRPPDAAATHDSFRHRKFAETVRSSSYDDAPVVAERYVEWACTQATQRHDDGVEAVSFTMVSQPSPIDGTYEEPRETTLIERECA